MKRTTTRSLLKTIYKTVNMEDTKKTEIEIQRLSADSGYFNNVFKKTEKILSVTLYILSELDVSDKTDIHRQNIKDKVLQTHEASLQTLSLQPQQQTSGLVTFQYALVGLESVIRMAEMSGALPKDIVQLILGETDAVHRYIQNHYLKQSPLSTADLTETVIEKDTPQKYQSQKPKTPRAQRRTERVNIPAGDISSDAYLVYSQLTDRAERIKTVLEAKPQATVKDISEVITDVSEKTIQRELNSLIEKGQVIREGERRWSKYSVKK